MVCCAAIDTTEYVDFGFLRIFIGFEINGKIFISTNLFLVIFD
jgi:hypothetical protein